MGACDVELEERPPNPEPGADNGENGVDEDMLELVTPFVVEEKVDDGGLVDAGVPPVSSAWGIGGSDSSNEAPNDDVGLKAFIPVNPVDCGCSGALKEDPPDVVFVEPVGWLNNDELVIAVLPVGWLDAKLEKADDDVPVGFGENAEEGVNDGAPWLSPCFLEGSIDQVLLNANDDATSAIMDPLSPSFGPDAPSGDVIDEEGNGDADDIEAPPAGGNEPACC